MNNCPRLLFWEPSPPVPCVGREAESSTSAPSSLMTAPLPQAQRPSQRAIFIPTIAFTVPWLINSDELCRNEVR